MAKVGFVGVGHMGGPMAANLLAKGHEVAILDPIPENVAVLTSRGATSSDSTEDLARGKEVIITMLPSAKEVQSVYLESGGLVESAEEGALLIDCSTANVPVAREVSEAAKERGLHFLDAPVSGGVAGAESGTLTFMVGGPEAALELAKPILSDLGKNLVHVGGPGTGQAAKICNNLILGITMIGVSEAFILAEELGLSPEKLFAVSSTSSGQCWSLTAYCPVPGLVPSAPSNRDYQPGFSAKMMLKDLRLAMEAAEESDRHLALGEMATRLYEEFVQEGSGNLDFSGIIRDLRFR